jgi:hypothetical protein
MNPFNSFTKIIIAVFKLIVTKVKLVEDLMVRTDDENLEKLLKTPADKVKFQKAIDHISRDLNSQEIILNGKHVTIST